MKNRYKKILMCSLAIFISLTVAAQNNKMYTGSILDEKGEPVVGATIRVQGSKLATISDLDGKYKIDAPAGSRLVVSYLGYKDVTTTGGNLRLQASNTDLNEVVVVGYGSQKKADLTGAVSTVPMDDIQDLSSGGLASMLGGLVPGLSVSGGQGRPGDNAQIYIRDTNDLSDIGSTAQEPLFVIDGYIYPNDVKVGNVSENLGAEAFNNLDPSEIESISVLKDASAAVYGARAANGVILVTTKKGKIGTPKISYSGTFGFTTAASTPKMLNAYEYGKMYDAVVAADPYDAYQNKTTELFQADELQAMKNLNYNLLDKYWHTGATLKHSVNISGASGRASYFGGIAYFKQGGNLGELSYNRWNYRTGIDVKISKYMGANLTVSGDYGKKMKPLIKVAGSNEENDYRSLLYRPRYIPETVNGNPIFSYGVSNTLKDNVQRYAFNVLQSDGDYSRDMTSNLNINSSLNYDFGWSKILRGLKFTFSYSKSISHDKGNEYGSSYTLYAMQKRFGSGSHLYTPVGNEDPSAYYESNNFIGSQINNGNYLSRNMVRTDNYQINFTAQYARDFSFHHIQALFSIEKSEAESEYLDGYVSEPYSFTTGQSNSAVGSTDYTIFTRSESGTLSYIGRINYSYAEKYLFEFLIRSDASTKFAPENYWGVFPSASAGWIISEENWFKKAAPWVNFLKMRGSFGLTGRDNTAPWQWMQVYAQDSNNGVLFGNSTSLGSGSRITINKNNSAVNRDVHWDKDYKADIGLDFQVLNNRFGGTIDFYRDWNREMLMNIAQTVPGTVGTQSAATNLGEMDNWGWEFSLNWNDKIGKDFKYRIGVNTGYGDNKVLNMDFVHDYLYRQIRKNHRSDVGIWGMQCLGMFRSFQDIDEYFTKYHITSYMGLSKDQVRPGMLIYKDVRGAQQSDGSYAKPNGVVSYDEDQVCLSKRSSNPYGFTLNLNISYKGISLITQLRASWGAYNFIPSQALKPYYDIEATNMPAFWKASNMYSYQNVYDGAGNLVVAENREAEYPNLKYASINSVTSSFWRVSAKQVTLNHLTVAYSIPKTWLNLLNIGIENARINITGQNLICFCNPYPDHFIYPLGSYGSYPTLRKFTIGINVTF